MADTETTEVACYALADANDCLLIVLGELPVRRN